MPPTLSWKEVRAIKSSGSRRTVSGFDAWVRNIKGQYGYIDLFRRRKLTVAHTMACP